MDRDSQTHLPSRPKASVFNYFGDFFNTVKAFIGTNYLALPFAFMQSGVVLGSIGVLIIAVLTDHCCQLLVKCKYFVIDNIIEDELGKKPMGDHELTALRQRLERTIGFGDLGAIVLGKWCKVLIDLTVAFTQFLTCCCYYIFLANSIYTLFPMEPAAIPMNRSEPVPSGFGRDAYVDNIYGYIENPLSRLENGIPMLNIPNMIKQRLIENAESNVPFTNTLPKPSGLPTLEQQNGFSDNIMTGIPSNMTTTPAVTMPAVTTPYPTPKLFYKIVAPDMRFLCMIPLPFFLATSLVRKLRYLSPFTLIATAALFGGALAVFISIVSDFTLAAHFTLYKLRTLPLFIGQLISAYEGIGCVLPIESSMEGNRHMFPAFVHGAVYIVFVILTSFGIFGYLRYGENVPQIIILALNPGIISKSIEITLIVSVLFTYPLQCYPVILIMENYLFAPGHIFGPRKPHLMDDDDEDADLGKRINEEERQGLLAQNSMTASVSSHGEEVAIEVPPTVPGWKRNIFRIFLALTVLGFGIWLRNSYAFVSAFSGAVGCSLLAYILPCLIHIRLRRGVISTWYIFKDLVIIFLAIAASIMALALIFDELIHPHPINRNHHHHHHHHHRNNSLLDMP